MKPERKMVGKTLEDRHVAVGIQVAASVVAKVGLKPDMMAQHAHLVDTAVADLQLQFGLRPSTRRAQRLAELAHTAFTLRVRQRLRAVLPLPPHQPVAPKPAAPTPLLAAPTARNPSVAAPWLNLDGGYRLQAYLGSWGAKTQFIKSTGELVTMACRIFEIPTHLDCTEASLQIKKLGKAARRVLICKNVPLLYPEPTPVWPANSRARHGRG
jgi:hypothetical protein